MPISTTISMMRGPVFRSEQWAIGEEYLDDDGVHLRVMAADSWILPRFSQ